MHVDLRSYALSSLLRDTKIGIRIGMALVLPVVGMLIFSGLTVFEKQQTVNEMKKLEGLAKLGPVISAVVHELQKERGTSAVYIGSKGKKFAAQLPVQKKDTDSKNILLTAAFDKFKPDAFSIALVGKVKAARDALAQLNDKRAKIVKFGLTVPQMAGYYTPTIARLLSIVEEMAVLSSNAQVTNAITAYTSFLQGKERAGIERAMGGAGFGAGKFKPVIYKKFIGLIAQQETFFGVFRIYGTEGQKKFFKDTLVGPDVKEVDRMRKIAIASIETKDVQGIQGPYWFGTITKKINLLKKVEDKIAGELLELTLTTQSSAQTSFFFFALVTVALLLVTAVLVIVIVRSITGPIGRMTESLSALAEGDKAVVFTGADRGDEIGAMGRAANIFRENMIRADELAEEQIKDHKTKEIRQGRVEQYISEFELTMMAVLEGMKGADSVMKKTGQEMDSGANETNAQAVTVATAAEEASVNVQTVASATEELSSSVQEISRQVKQSSEIASRAVSETSHTMDNIKELETSVTKIGDVVSLITDIAEQTNLLALNATIEAARAGDSGKGFAVVASEVKNLANQTARATEDIGKQIEEVQKSTEISVKSISGIADVINQVSQVSGAIAVSVDEQDAATRKIAMNVEQAATGTSDVSSSIIVVRDSTAKSIELAQGIKESSAALSEQTESLDKNVKEFLEKVRSADGGRTDELIVWNNSVSVGHGMIDQEHQKLIQIINGLYTAVCSKADAETVGAGYKEMKDYTDYHFDHEEKMMIESNYPDYEMHKRQHENFAERLEELYQNYLSGRDASGSELLNLLGSWWTTHITTSDIKLANYARKAA